MNPKPSLKDIAKIVGVSVPLVSYVLSNKGKENRVSEKTAKKIRKVAKELNYHPNWNAKSLKTNKTRSIGVILADISNPFFSHLARTIEDEAFSQDYTVIFGSSDEKVSKFKKVLDFLKMRQVDGFIIAAPEGSKDIIVELVKSKIPFVLIDRFFKDIETNFVTVDNYNASLQATNYLLKKGHEKIALVMYNSQLAHYQDRCEGYLAALKSKQSIIEKVNHRSLSNDMKAIIKKLIYKDGIEAIYFQTNTLAEEGLKQLVAFGKNVMNGIDVVVFDQNLAYHFLENFIPYINQPIKKMGQKSVQMLIDQIEGNQEGKIHVQLKTKLVTAKSNKV